MKGRLTIGLSALVLMVALIGALLLGGAGQDALAAPAAAPTPLFYNPNGPNSQEFAFWQTKAITLDTRSCVPVNNFDVGDFQWVIDQGSPVNTTTLTIQYFNIPAVYENAAANLVTATAVDGHDMQQVALFGANVCVFADVANTNVVTVSARSKFK